MSASAPHSTGKRPEGTFSGRLPFNYLSCFCRKQRGLLYFFRLLQNKYSPVPCSGQVRNYPGSSWRQPPAGGPRCWRWPPGCTPGRGESPWGLRPIPSTLYPFPANPVTRAWAVVVFRYRLFGWLLQLSFVVSPLDVLFHAFSPYILRPPHIVLFSYMRGPFVYCYCM